MREASLEFGSNLAGGRDRGRKSEAVPSVLAWMTDWMRVHSLRQGTRDKEQARLGHGAIGLSLGHGEFEVPVGHQAGHSGNLTCESITQEISVWDFPGGPEVENPAKAGHIASTPGLGVSHMPGGS